MVSYLGGLLILSGWSLIRSAYGLSLERSLSLIRVSFIRSSGGLSFGRSLNLIRVVSHEVIRSLIIEVLMGSWGWGCLPSGESSSQFVLLLV